jgi:hypothetical protein
MEIAAAAMQELYNPAQVDVLRRVRRLQQTHATDRPAGGDVGGRR